MNLNERQVRLLREQTLEGRAFREGARCEAEMREAATLLHRELIDYVRALAEHNPQWTSGRIARTAALVFNERERPETGE